MLPQYTTIYFEALSDSNTSLKMNFDTNTKVRIFTNIIGIDTDKNKQ